MALNNRERNIAVVAGAAVVLGGLYWLLLAPYLDQRDAIAAQLKTAHDQLDSADTLFHREQHLRPIWADMQRGGLSMDASTASSQFYQSLLEWAQQAGTSGPSIKTDLPKSERTAPASKFQEISFHVTVTGSLSSISRLMWSMETANIPVRVKDIQLTPRKEGTNDLSAQLTISTLCMVQDTNQADKPAAPPTPAPAVEGSQS